MKTFTWFTLTLLGAAGVLAFTRYPGLPYWPKNSAGHNYVVNLHPSRFPVSGEWDMNALWASSDWRDLGGTSFVQGVLRIAADYGNHADGLNTWDFANEGNNGVLATTFVRWSGNTMRDCDIVFNSFYSWTTRLQDPNENHPASPYDFRAVARHECGHAIGFDHENALLTAMNSIYSVGAGVPHAMNWGQLPHADDKFGCRIVYPPGVPTQTVNLMCTSWRAPAPSSGQARKLQLAQSTYAAGSQITVPVLVENQSNVSIPTGPFGCRLALYLSPDKTITISDTRFLNYSFASDFGPHAVGYYELNAVVPPNTLAGQYYVGAIIDCFESFDETFENDNFAWYGPITITNRPDLVIESITPATTTPVRGSNLGLRFTVRNLGYGPAPASGAHTYLIDGQTNDLAREFFLAVAQIPAIPPLGSVNVDYPMQLPADLCGAHTYNLRADADSWSQIDELNESNNTKVIQVSPQWPAAAGYYVGTRRRYVDGWGPSTVTICSKAQSMPLTPTTWYFLLWTCSGTSPGIPLPPGVLPLNYDVCTQIAPALEGTRLAGSKGIQTSSAAGELMTVRGDSWLQPLRGYPTHWAAVYIDVAVPSIVGVSRNAALMFVR